MPGIRVDLKSLAPGGVKRRSHAGMQDLKTICINDPSPDIVSDVSDHLEIENGPGITWHFPDRVEGGFEI